MKCVAATLSLSMAAISLHCTSTRLGSIDNVDLESGAAYPGAKTVLGIRHVNFYRDVFTYGAILVLNVMFILFTVEIVQLNDQFTKIFIVYICAIQCS